MKSHHIGVVIVTFNRARQLAMALNAYEGQSCKPSYIIVVNNNSTDGTLDYLNEWEQTPSEYQKQVIHLEKNIGGSGGFYEGLKVSLDFDADWIWVADDDAYPDLSAIEIADRTVQDKNIVDESVSALCGAVINNGDYDCGHRRRIFLEGSRIREVPAEKDEYQKDNFEIQLFSYVGAVIRKSVLQQVGLPKKDYFIWYDDTEHSMRLAKEGKILCIPAIRITHDIASQGDTNTIDWKFYYGLRNKLDFYKSHFPTNVYLYYHFRETGKAYWNLLLNKKPLMNKIRLQAVKDAFAGKLGLHSIYKPGWKSGK